MGEDVAGINSVAGVVVVIVVNELGPSPHAEECAQLGAEGYELRARRECRAFIAQLRRMAEHAGVALDGVMFFTKASYHDFGTYYEVAIRYDDRDEAAEILAEWIDSNVPTRWDDEARRALNLEVTS